MKQVQTAVMFTGTLADNETPMYCMSIIYNDPDKVVLDAREAVIGFSRGTKVDSLVAQLRKMADDIEAHL